MYYGIYTNNMETCLNTFEKATNYVLNFERKTGYVKVSYEWMDENIVSKIVIYFSNIYCFSNIIFNDPLKEREKEDYLYWKDESRLASYYIEVWIFDTLNYREQITEVHHYY